ncbi:MAG: NAD(P)/FAD-dependent oxidoreductase, partial [Thalassotalea sp.]|nr:NAD(P)/FAD-dependent oxidoreductase [Thalassotalea sp.]
RCNFTNQNATPENYLCHNPHFVKSALSRYTQYDFIDMVERHGIEYHHKTLGQLFCDDSAHDIVNMLTTECDWAGVAIHLQSEVVKIAKTDDGFIVTTSGKDYQCQSLVIASGGLTMPKLGASPIGYKIAEQFGLKLFPTCAALVPFTLQDQDKQRFDGLSGISVDCDVTSVDGTSFRENILFTHRGLSGPAILQISSFWQAGQEVSINLLPEFTLSERLQQARTDSPKQALKTALSHLLPKRLIERLYDANELPDKVLNQITHAEFDELNNYFHNWKIKPNGTEGYRTAEVTLGGVDTDELSSKTMESKKVAGLYFIGEVADVTGWLGGYNFQWAWSSGWAAGQVA